MNGTFYRVYRPQKFDELVGQELVKSTLSQAVKENRTSHAYLFTGPRGTGKTTTARILSKAINCEKRDKKTGEPCNTCNHCKLIDEGKTLDLIEIDAASYTGVDNIRQLTENIELSPSQMPYRVFIIDEVHMLSKGAFNALLKTLEEPPSHTIFILATTEYQKVPATISSRCQRFFFSLFTLPEIRGKIEKIAKAEKIKIDEEGTDLIGEASQGGMRDAESLFSQVVALKGKKIDAKEVKEILGISSQDTELQLLNHLLSKKSDKTLEQIEELVKKGQDIFLLSHRLLDYLRKILLIKTNNQADKILGKEISKDQIEKLKNLSELTSITELIDLTGKIVRSQPEIKNTSIPQLPLELAVTDWSLINTSQEKHNTEEDEEEVDIPLVEEPKKEVNIKEPRKARIAKSSTDLKSVLEKWNRITRNIRELQPALYTLLKTSSPARIEGDTLIISTPFKFHKDKLSNQESKKIICSELKKGVGIEKVSVIEDGKLKNENINEDEAIEKVKDLLKVKKS